MIKLIGLTGMARSGKDTAALYLRDEKKFKTYAFAEPIKEACKVMFNWTDDHVNGALKELIDHHYGVSPRYAMQTLGTEWGRETMNPNIWLKRAQCEIDDNELLVITDIRFNNEARLIRNNGGIVINVIRDDRPDVKAHSSENGVHLNLINHNVLNNGTIEELHDKIRLIVCEK